MQYVITLLNAGGELDRRVVKSQDEIKETVASMVDDLEFFSPGDRIEISEQEAAA